MNPNKKYSVLIVDDDKFLLDMYTKKFKKYDIEADFSIGSEGVLNRLHEGYTPDIILLDIIMPGMDGLELLEQIRKEKLVSNAVVIMLTNENESASIEKAKSLGVDGYIVKSTSIPSEVVEEVLKIANNQKNKVK